MHWLGPMETEKFIFWNKFVGAKLIFIWENIYQQIFYEMKINLARQKHMKSVYA